MAALFTVQTASGQAANNRPSPADSATGMINNASVKIKYSSPSVKGRPVWGAMVPYGQVWRAGANEATTFETEKDITVEGKTLPAGKYALFALPTEKDWTIIFNKTANQWGAFRYDDKQDALRVQVTPRKSASFNERLAYKIGNEQILLQWENLEVPISIKAAGN